MAIATTTTLGEIQLAGDLAGVNNGLAPELTATGITAGSYSIPAITVDGKGRITSIASTTLASLLPTATASTFGAVKPDNTTITISSGVISAVLPIGTSTTFGTVKPDNSSITISSGVISAVFPTANSTTVGLVKGDGTTIDSTGGVLSVLGTTVAKIATGTQQAWTGMQSTTPYVASVSAGGTLTLTGYESNIYMITATNSSAVTINFTTIPVGAKYTIVFNYSSIVGSVTLKISGVTFDTYTPAATGFQSRSYVSLASGQRTVSVF